MSWQKENILILVKAAPNWSTKYKEYEICTAGINENDEWRRLYPFPEDIMLKKDIKLWDRIEVETAVPSADPRPESRKINAESIKKIDYIDNRDERRKFLENVMEPSLEIPMKEKRTMTVIKPIINNFTIKQKIPEVIQIALDGKPFKRSPYGDLGLYYNWQCPKPCRYCRDRSHLTQCLDWGAHVLYRRYQDEKEAITKVKQMCYYKMKYDLDTWFALGTHSRRPWKKWMIVGLLWMKKKPSQVS